jgi:hypothetical protein
MRNVHDGRFAMAPLVLLALLAAVAVPAGATGFHLTDPSSPVYRTLAAAAGSDLSVEHDAQVTGNVHSNSGVSVKSGAQVTGNVSAAGAVDNKGTITGTVTSGAPARALPVLLSEAEARALANRIFEQETVLSNTTIDDVVFVKGKARLTGAVNGTGTIIATGDIEMDPVGAGTGPGLLQPSTSLSLIAFQHVKIQDNRSFRGVAYAGMHVMIEKGVHFEGVAVARQQVQIRDGAVVAFLPPANDHEPPTVSIVSPIGVDVFGPALPAISILYGDSGSGIDLASLQVLLDGASLLGSCSVSPTGVSCPGPTVPEGIHALQVIVRDVAGNRSVAEVGVRTISDVDPPAVSILAPGAGLFLSTANPEVRASFADGGSGIDARGVSLLVDAIDRTAEAAVSTTGLTWNPPAPLSDLPHTVQVVVRDRAGHSASASVSFSVDTTLPELTVDAPAAGLALNRSETAVSGGAADDNGVRVEVNGQPVPLAGGRFQLSLPLAEGAQTVTVRAIDAAGNARQENRPVTRFSLPAVAITAPQDLGYLAATTVNVTGTVSNGAQVVVNGVPATVSGTSFTAADVPLVEGGNLLTATATDAGGHVATDTLNVVRDLTAPRVLVEVPENGARIASSSVTVSGLINDIVAGTVNASEATVTVNGRPARVANRSFVATDVPLTPGDNVLTVQATDASGNRGSASLTVRQETPAGPRIVVVSGDLQEGEIDQPLAAPLVVALLDAAGQPVAGQPVLFSVRDSSGHLDGGRRQVAVTTGADGHAQASFTLGSRAGVANQIVEASRVGFAGPAIFRLGARAGAPRWILADAGTLQVGIAGRTLPQPLVAAVTDEGFNRLPDVEVNLRVLQGGGTFEDGSTARVVRTDSDGRIVVPFVLGPEEGIANNVVEATLVDLDPSPKATFVASGRVAGDPAATSISGVVLDNANQPVPGVTLRIKERPQLTAQADAQGLFRIAGAPVGTVHLIVDGSTASRPGSWPDLEFVVTTVPGRDTTVNMPIFLLPIDVAGGLFVDETHGGLLTLPEYPGFALEVKPGSVTFPGGSRSGVISVTAVHGDKVPMVPNFGQQPRFIVTIQPAGARFDPPARLVLPNLEGLAPGEVTEMYSFDHDLGHFVSIGPGTVSEDGMLIASNPGVGVVKAGWHCGGDPAAAGTPADCPSCQICNGSACVPGCALGASSQATPDLAAIFAASCTCTTDNDDCTVNDRCQTSGCHGDPVNVTAIQGPCAAPKNTPATFTATFTPAGGGSAVKWTASGGTPASGKGASFSSRWASRGDYVVQATCKSGKSKRVSVLKSCSESVSVPTVIDTPPPAGTITPDEDGAFYGGNPIYLPEPCVDSPSNQYCVAITKFESQTGYSLVSAKTDVSSASDPIITDATCQAILQDLTPSAASTYGQPPATQYYSRSISENHEKKHVQDFKDLVLTPLLNELKAYAAGKCQGCTSPFPQADLDAKEAELLAQKTAAFAVVKEPQAYAQSNAEYAALVAAIRARATAEGWRTACR